MANFSLDTLFFMQSVLCSLFVQFHVRYKTEFGQEVYLVGNCNALGNWDVLSGVRLKWGPGHVWEGSVELPAG